MAAPEKRYEMLWDCPACGARKLLGLTHRHCPGCGSPQDSSKRYFPSDGERVAVEDHPYAGADKRCGHCGSAWSAKTAFCGGCGAGLDDSAAVALIRDPADPPGAAASKPAPARVPSARGASKAGWAVVGLAAAAIGVFYFSKRAATVTVSGHSWRREVQVERFGPVEREDWCGEMASGAYKIERRRERRSTRSVPDGQECRVVKRDLGDGTFKEEQECSPKTKEVAVYDERCSYAVNAWAQGRAETAAGQALEPAPAWPRVTLRAGDCVGCEREGGRTEAYLVRFAGEGGPYECDLAEEAKWRAFSPGSRWKGERRLGKLLCSGLQRAE